MDVEDALEQQRSVRFTGDKPVTNEATRAKPEQSRPAPSAGNVLRWRGQ